MYPTPVQDREGKYSRCWRKAWQFGTQVSENRGSKGQSQTKLPPFMPRRFSVAVMIYHDIERATGIFRVTHEKGHRLAMPYLRNNIGEFFLEFPSIGCTVGTTQ